MSYVDIRQALGEMNTGQLNYHLKVLDDLISKDTETGRYTLTDKGASALRMDLSQGDGVSSFGPEMHSTPIGVAGNIGLSTYAGVGAAVIAALAATYYLFLHLHTIKFPSMVAISTVWFVIIFFSWRGLSTQTKDRKLPPLNTGNGGN